MHFDLFTNLSLNGDVSLTQLSIQQIFELGARLLMALGTKIDPVD